MSRYEEMYYQRTWLNVRRGRAHIIATVDGTTKQGENRYQKPNIDAYFEVADCNNTSSLDFSMDDLNDKKECRKIINKLKRFRESFEKFEQVILDTIEEANS